MEYVRKLYNSHYPFMQGTLILSRPLGISLEATGLTETHEEHEEMVIFDLGTSLYSIFNL